MSQEFVPYTPESPIKVIPHVINVWKYDAATPGGTGSPEHAAKLLQDMYNSIEASGGTIERVHDARVYDRSYLNALFFVVRMADAPVVSDFDTPADAPNTGKPEYNI